MFYKLTLADLSVIEDIYKLVEQRIAWMNEVGIKQWNVTNYCDIYTREYFINQMNKNSLYVLKQMSNDKIAGAIVCLETDERWKDSLDTPAYYLHNFVTDKNAKEAGTTILKLVEELALRNNKKRLRLDCAIDNVKLNNYYEQNGFVLAGYCEDGLYKGNKREKVLMEATQICLSNK